MLNRLRNVFRPKRLEAEIREELEFHQAQTSGSFGNAMLLQDRARDASTIVWLQTLLQDLGYGLRQFRKAPVLVAAAIVSLALGIGANTAIFTLIDAVVLQSLPVRDPGQLALFYDGISTGVYSGDGMPGDAFSYPSWEYLHSHQDSFEDLCAFRQGTDRVRMYVPGTPQGGVPERAQAHLVSGSYFNVLGVNASAGRVILPPDDAVSAPPVAVISYRFWQIRFHGANTIIGQAVVLNGFSFTLVGVAHREFFGERVQTPPDFWIPLSFEAPIPQRESWLAARDQFWLNLLGRLKPGITIRAADVALTTQLRQFYAAQVGTSISESNRRKLEDVHVDLKPGGAGISGLRYRYSQPLHLLMAVVAILLLIACANIATLLLARAKARSREFSARIALGASRSRIVRQVLTESVLLSALGGIAGTCVAWGMVVGLARQMDIDPVVKVRPDPSVLAFTLAISAATGLVFGAIPAFRFGTMEPHLGLPVRTPESRSRGIGSAQTLIVLQVALSFVLLLGTALLARSLVATEFQDFGFHRENILIVHTDPQLAGYTKDELFPLYRELDERLNRIPGVKSASLARYTPMSGSSSSGSFGIQGHTSTSGATGHLYRVEVGPRYFETLGIPLRMGRPIGPLDTPAAPLVAVVNETFVAKYLPHERPIGKRFSLGYPCSAPGFEIVGVVPDAMYFDVHEAAKPMAFLAAWQGKGDSPYVGDMILRTSLPLSALLAEVRRVLSGISNRLPVLFYTTLDQQIEESRYQQEMVTTLCSVFGFVALLLASIGIYGTLAYTVSRRTTEIGIRMAIGAPRGSVLWMVLRESILLVAVGLVIGVPLAFLATRWIRSFLYGAPVADPLAFGAAVLLIEAASLFAGYLPAHRATKIDPMVALRYE